MIVRPRLEVAVIPTRIARKLTLRLSCTLRWSFESVFTNYNLDSFPHALPHLDG